MRDLDCYVRQVVADSGLDTPVEHVARHSYRSAVAYFHASEHWESCLGTEAWSDATMRSVLAAEFANGQLQ